MVIINKLLFEYNVPCVLVSYKIGMVARGNFCAAAQAQQHHS
jgi:hypothetical protein